MGQIKIFGLRKTLHSILEQTSAIIHNCYVEAFQYPVEKKAHRFIYIDADSFFYFETRSEKHVIIEINMFEGRSAEAKKKFYQLLFTAFETQLGIENIDVEILLIETSPLNWGIRGKSGDELKLSYKVNI